ncbi:adhesin [Pontibacillus halophilus JSM 076056 = DSM 19796]|uniref:Adhesin n=2 Tax=Pontibacillus TaxID=289201 RepID=A0A0A5GMD9_9BACI|nr:adhesin [Pontibacillus halophilus JSM 076056 = DSM 19796]
MSTLFGFMLLLLVLVACSGAEETSSNDEASGDSSNEDKLKIYTTIYPLLYFTEQIGGETVDVESILPPGSDAHTYEPTSKEMVELAGADLFMMNGAELEPYASSMADALKKEEVEILEASKDIELIAHNHHSEHEEGNDHSEEHDHGEESVHTEDHEHEEGHDEESHHDSNHNDEESSHEGHHHGDEDPHIWLDPVRAKEMAANVKEQLVSLNPEDSSVYEQNYESLVNRLDELNQMYEDKLQNLSDKKFIVSHAAYGYWENAYGVEQIPVSGLSPSEVPSQKSLERVIEEAKANNLEYIYFEQNVTDRVANVIKDELDAKPIDLHNLSVLTTEDIEQDEDYFTIMERNLEHLLKEFE